MKEKLKTTIYVIRQNKSEIKRKLIIAGGTALGMFIASTVLDRVNNAEPDIIFVTTTPDGDVTATEFSAQ